jgi:hypothetical protein
MSRKSFQWEPTCSMRTSSRTDTTTLTVAFRSFANPPKNSKLLNHSSDCRHFDSIQPVTQTVRKCLLYHRTILTTLLQRTFTHALQKVSSWTWSPFPAPALSLNNEWRRPHCTLATIQHRRARRHELLRSGWSRPLLCRSQFHFLKKLYGYDVTRYG